MAAGAIENPILNGPYEPPALHFELGPSGPTGVVIEGRRPSESFIPVPAPRKGKNKAQQVLDLDTSGERRERNELINEIRYQVGLWRQRGYPESLRYRASCSSTGPTSWNSTRSPCGNSSTCIRAGAASAGSSAA